MSDTDPGQPFDPEAQLWQKDRAALEADTAAAVKTLGGRAVRAIVTLLVLLGIVGVLYVTGWLNRGFEKRHVAFNHGVSTSGTGFSMGPKSFYLRAGQTFVAPYTVTVQRGGLYLWLRRKTLGFEMPVAGQIRITSSGQGELRVPIRENGYYKLIIDGSPDGNGYDVDYKVAWRAE